MDDVKTYECTVLIDASSSANVKAKSPEEAAELAENEVVERGAGSLCHQCSNHTEVGDVYAVVVYENGEEVLDTDFRSIRLKDALAREAALREELASVCSMACMLEDREWAEHAAKGPIAEKMEYAITEMHNELTAAEQRNADAIRMLTALYEVTPFVWPDVADFLTKNKPAESGASE